MIDEGVLAGATADRYPDVRTSPTVGLAGTTGKNKSKQHAAVPVRGGPDAGTRRRSFTPLPTKTSQIDFATKFV